MKVQSRQARKETQRRISELENSILFTDGLPDGILLTALRGYENGTITLEAARARFRAVRILLENECAEKILFTATRGSVGLKRPAAAVAMFHVVPQTMESGNRFLGGFTRCLVFFRWGCWLYSSFEPVGATAHLHQRVIQRARNAPGGLVTVQDGLSDFWPLLLQLGNHRRKHGRPAAITTFMSPWGGGMLFGDMSRLEPNDLPMVEIIDFRNGTGVRQQLQDGFSVSTGERLLVQMRTFIDANLFKPHQFDLFQHLVSFLERHRRVADYFKYAGRLGCGGGSAFEEEIQDIFFPAKPASGEISDALEELDEITQSDA